MRLNYTSKETVIEWKTWRNLKETRGKLWEMRSIWLNEVYGISTRLSCYHMYRQRDFLLRIFSTVSFCFVVKRYPRRCNAFNLKKQWFRFHIEICYRSINRQCKTLEYQWLAYTKPVDESFLLLWLATRTLNSICHTPPPRLNI